MRFIILHKSISFIAGPVLNKSLEVEIGKIRNPGFTVFGAGVRFNTRGDHAGLRAWLDFFIVFFSVTIYDTRHWNYAENRFHQPGEEPVFEGYPHE